MITTSDLFSLLSASIPPTSEPKLIATGIPIGSLDSTVMLLEFDKKSSFILFYIDDFEYTPVMNESYPKYIDVNTTWINKIPDEGFMFYGGIHIMLNG